MTETIIWSQESARDGIALDGAKLCFVRPRSFIALSSLSNAGSKYCEMTVGVVRSLAFSQFYHSSYLAALLCPYHTDNPLVLGDYEH